MVQAIHQVVDEQIPQAAGIRDTALSNAQLANGIKEAVNNGSLRFTCCLVKHVPFMLEGPLRPVTLSCCNFTVSYAGAQDLIAAGRCHFCKARLKADTKLLEDEAVARIIAAERHGYTPRVVKSGEVVVGDRIGAGGDGKVFRATFRGRPVALKVIQLKEDAAVRDCNSLKNVIATTYMAGIASEHICKLHGVCWKQSELWCALCDLISL